MPRVNATQLAAHLKVSKPRISILKREGRVKFDPDGTVDLAVALAMIESTRQPANNIGYAVGTSNLEKSGAPPPTQSESAANLTPQKGRTPTLLEAKTHTEIWRGKAMKLGFDKEDGRLVDADAEKRAGYLIGRKIRDSILAIPLRVSSILAAEMDEFVVRETLTAELTQALQELSDANAKA